MKTYKHTQPAVTILFVTGAIALTFLCISAAQPKFLLGAAALAVLAWLLRSLTTEVTETELIWRFGGGWITKRIPLSEIASTEVVRTGILEGWGVHYTRFGWLYNVSGFEAVAITLHSGKRFALGTDEAEKLVSVLSRG